MNLMVKQMSEDTLEDLRRIFNKLDSDLSGSIDVDELRNALETTCTEIDANEDMVKELIKQVDNNYDGCINYTEFIAATIGPNMINDENRLNGLFN